jgi:hypothetical protein
MAIKQKQPYFLVLTERDPDGQIMIGHDMRREVIRARFRNEFITTVEISDAFKGEMLTILDETEQQYICQ